MNHLILLHSLKFKQFIRFWIAVDDLTLKILPSYLNFLKFIHRNQLIHFTRVCNLWLKARRSKPVNFNIAGPSSNSISLVTRVDYFINVKQLVAASNSNLKSRKWCDLALFNLQPINNPLLFMRSFYTKFIYFLDSWMMININYLYKLVSYLNLKVKPNTLRNTLFVINIKKILCCIK
jgi:hypothetical protein